MTTGLPLNESELATAASTNIVIGDWIWHKDRSPLVQKGQWHNYSAERRFMFAFGDGHAEFFRFPPNYGDRTTPEPVGWPDTKLYNVTNGFW